MKKDLVKSLERKNPLFVFVVSLLVHSGILYRATGFGFRNSVFTYSGDRGVLYHSKKEIESAGKYFFGLIKKQSKKLNVWHKRAIKQNRISNDIIKKFLSNKNNHSLSIKSYNLILKEFVDTFLYCTVIPYWVLFAIEKNQKRVRADNYRKIFEKIRSESSYPRFASVVLSQYFKKAAGIMGVENNLAGYLTPLEMRSVLSNKNRISISELKKREKWCSVSNIFKSGKLIFSYEKEKFEKIVKPENPLLVKSIKGNIAYPGIARGKVKIINAIEDMRGFKKGEIIVSINTNPSLMPIIKKCKAIVADEGGIMCHAAIVSRELKIPCVIGTKIATKVLKDGDMVEVDADKGIVKILNKK